MLRGAELDGIAAGLRLGRLVADRQRSLDEPVRMLPLVLLAHERRHRPAQEPGGERAVEELELVVARDERLAEREVDVLLAREVDGVEAAKRVEHAARPDLDPHLAEHAAERDHVPDDRRSLHQIATPRSG